MSETQPKVRISRELIKKQHEHIQGRISEASTPLETVLAYSLYLKVLFMDVLTSLGMVYQAEEKPKSE